MVTCFSSISPKAMAAARATVFGDQILQASCDGGAQGLRSCFRLRKCLRRWRCLQSPPSAWHDQVRPYERMATTRWCLLKSSHLPSMMSISSIQKRCLRARCCRHEVVGLTDSFPARPHLWRIILGGDVKASSMEAETHSRLSLIFKAPLRKMSMLVVVAVGSLGGLIRS